MTALDNLEILSEAYKSAFRRMQLPAVEGCEIDLTAPDFFGSMWGKSESNTHRQKWRWLSPLGYSNIFVRLNPVRDYRARTHIHTALPKALDVLSATANGSQVPIGGMDWIDGKLSCWLIIPKAVLIADKGFLRLTYAVDFGKLDAAAAASVDRRNLIAFTDISFEVA